MNCPSCGGWYPDDIDTGTSDLCGNCKREGFDIDDKGNIIDPERSGSVEPIDQARAVLRTLRESEPIGVWDPHGRKIWPKEGAKTGDSKEEEFNPEDNPF